ncbi:UNVERIFIED_CONTAM: Dicer-like protein 4 [Sesamum latifolium]|uniref:Dicer-like protein 4 n=1 Tax=Sesamum latifolium TaxID=2727402 RepID=A0AAW2VEQ5_9LAMI
MLLTVCLVPAELTGVLCQAGCLPEEWRDKEEHFIELPPEICQLKVIGFSKDIGSSLSLLPSILHRLESFLVAIELKEKLVASFPEGAEVTAERILEALTTERCYEHFSLERLEVLGDAFLKFAVARHLFLKHDALDEGQLTRKRSNIVNNSNLLKLATRNNLQVYIRDQSFEADQFFAFGRSCSLSCNKETEKTIHPRSYDKKNSANAEIDNICSASKAFLPLADQMDVNALENLLGYKFAHKGLLIQAFVHPSFNNHLGGCYQRLEFLGDAVLDYLITSYLYSVYPNLKPGQLTDLRSVSVNNTSFADVAGRWSFHKFIICDSSVLRETMTKYVNNIGSSATAKGQIEEKTCPKALGDLVESCMGAVFLDTGFDLNHVWKIMLSLLDPIISFSKLQMNPLRELHELCQSYNWERDGKFVVEAKVDEGNVTATASATNVSGKVARRIAARQVSECLKAQGYKSKTKSLEEVLRKSKKMEAELIGYDETPCYGTSEFGGLKLLENSQSDHDVKVYALSETSTSKSRTIPKPMRDRPFAHEAPEFPNIQSNGYKIDSPDIHLTNGCDADPQGTGASHTVSAKSRLYEICAANCWKPPLFECWKETGPSHIKEFIFKIVMEIEELPNQIFEFYGEPRMRKKDAAEHAAQGALWYLKQEGYIWDKKRDR